jgi:hypothetical protein
MPSILEIEHCPEFRIRIGFTDLIQRCIILIDDLVDWAHHSSVLNSPSQIARSFTSDNVVLDHLIGSGRALTITCRREEFGYA